MTQLSFVDRHFGPEIGDLMRQAYEEGSKVSPDTHAALCDKLAGRLQIPDLDTFRRMAAARQEAKSEPAWNDGPEPTTVEDFFDRGEWHHRLIRRAYRRHGIQVQHGPVAVLARTSSRPRRARSTTNTRTKGSRRTTCSNKGGDDDSDGDGEPEQELQCAQQGCNRDAPQYSGKGARPKYCKSAACKKRRDADRKRKSRAGLFGLPSGCRAYPGPVYRFGDPESVGKDTLVYISESDPPLDAKLGRVKCECSDAFCFGRCESARLERAADAFLADEPQLGEAMAVLATKPRQRLFPKSVTPVEIPSLAEVRDRRIAQIVTVDQVAA